MCPAVRNETRLFGYGAGLFRLAMADYKRHMVVQNLQFHLPEVGLSLYLFWNNKHMLQNSNGVGWTVLAISDSKYLGGKKMSLSKSELAIDAFDSRYKLEICWHLIIMPFLNSKKGLQMKIGILQSANHRLRIGKSQLQMEIGIWQIASGRLRIENKHYSTTLFICKRQLVVYELRMTTFQLQWSLENGIWSFATWKRPLPNRICYLKLEIGCLHDAMTICIFKTTSSKLEMPNLGHICLSASCNDRYKWAFQGYIWSLLIPNYYLAARAKWHLTITNKFWRMTGPAQWNWVV